MCVFTGIGIGYVVLNALVCVYYNVIIAISLYYLFGSFTKLLPWGHCGNPWNTEFCVDEFDKSSKALNSTGECFFL